MTEGMTGDDRDLRARFAALRRQEEVHAPGFHALASPPQPVLTRANPGRKGWLVFAACLAASIASVLWWQRPIHERPAHRPAAPTVSVTAWTAPTQFLLNTPGGEMLRSVPAFGAGLDYGDAPRLPQKRRGQPKKVLPKEELD